MQEYLIHSGGRWWHFFIKPLYGLCYRKWDAGRFLNFEVLLPEAQEDFCVTAIGESIHLVCQDETGRILYLTMELGDWKKTVLLESKSPAPYSKHFSLVPIGKFINLFYVIAYQEKSMLVHQILGTDRPPTVIDRITPQVPMFLTGRHVGDDITVYYENDAGVSGYRVFRWSQKAFGRFIPVNPSVGGRVCCVLSKTGGHLCFGVLQRMESIRNLVYFEKQDEEFTQPVMVNLDCPEDALPIFYRAGEKLYLSWKESGSVMSSYSTDNGAHFTKPVRYMKGTSVTPVLYTVCNEGKTYQIYGYEKDQEIVFYIGSGIFDTPIQTKKREFRPAGYEVEEFAREMGAVSSEPEKVPENMLINSMQKEVGKLKEQLFTQRRILAEISERLAALEQTKSGNREQNGGIVTQTIAE